MTTPRQPAYRRRTTEAGLPLGRPAASPVVPVDPRTCPRCGRWVDACMCLADPDDMREVLGRIAEFHLPTGTEWCGCGAYRCPYRTRLAHIRPAQRGPQSPSVLGT